MNAKFSVDSSGYFGNFGGAYIPEMLFPPVDSLRENYLAIVGESSFQDELTMYLERYVGRPTPLYHAENLSNLYQTNILLKREDLCHTGAHKINNSIGQILLAKRLGKRRIVAETGAGQHGVATATVCALMGMECTIYMGAIDMARQKPNVARMKMLGAQLVSVESGSRTLKDATNEAMRHWIAYPDDTHYIIGSAVGPHPYPDLVGLFQSVISKETIEQLETQYHVLKPTAVIACVGGGSNAAGAFYHYLADEEVRLIGAEAAGHGLDSGKTAATLHKGTKGVLHGSITYLMQDIHGQVTEPHSISAGLDYPGIGPLHAHLHETGRATYVPITDDESIEAAILLARKEGIIPAIETAHALAVLDKIHFNSDDYIVICLSGRGDKDMETYMELLEQ